MTNIKSLEDYIEKENNKYKYAGGQNSGIGIDEGDHIINLYLDGFIVDGGVFRPLSDPMNTLFINDVKRGIAPPELQHNNHQINLHLIEHNINYLNNNIIIDKKNYLIGNINTNLKIKLSNGNLINLTISQSATIYDLKYFILQYINSSVSGSGSGMSSNMSSSMSSNSNVNVGDIKLLYGFPPKKINFDDTTTLKDADILNCNIIQKYFYI
uniref:SEP domain containing protein, putative n=1 Tax=Theileria annulata TaxID=5874 RepID=A0A3B0MUN5_THEAN